MALKRKIDKATYEALSADVKKEYKADGMDFVLDVEGFDDPQELKRAKDREKQRADDKAEEARKALEELATLRAQLDDAGTLDARKKGDIAALEKSWQTKLDAAVQAGATETTKLTAHLTKRLVDDAALAMAKEISTSPSLIVPHIRARLVADLSGDEPLTRVVGADGKPSALSLDDLRKEFVANTDFSAIIIGSKGSGSGADGGKQGDGGGATKKLAEMDAKERAAYNKRDPEGFKKESAALIAAGPRI